MKYFFAFFEKKYRLPLGRRFKLYHFSLAATTATAVTADASATAAVAAVTVSAGNDEDSEDHEPNEIVTVKKIAKAVHSIISFSFFEFMLPHYVKEAVSVFYRSDIILCTDNDSVTNVLRSK